MKTHRIRWTVIIVALCTAGLSILGAGHFIGWPPSRPNVLLLIIDTLRVDKLGCYGFPKEISPEIDKLAKNGVKFTNVISQCSWTRPSIGSMLTGLYPRTLGLYKEDFDILGEQHTTLAEILQANGYKTMGITSNPNINSVFNFNQGFDAYVDTDVIWPWMKPEKGKPIVDRKRHNPPGSQEVFRKALDAARAAGKGPNYLQLLVMEAHEGWSLVRPEFKNNDLGYMGVPPGYFDGIRQVSYDFGKFVNQLLRLPGWENTLFIITSDHGQGLFDHPSVKKSYDHGTLLYSSHVRVPLILYYPKPMLTANYWLSNNYLPKITYYANRLILRVAGWIRVGLPWQWLAIYRLPPDKTIHSAVSLLDLTPTLLDYLYIDVPTKMQGTSFVNLIYRRYKNNITPEIHPYRIAETNFSGSNKIAIYGRNWKYIENRDGHEGVNARELQPSFGTENGKVTDKITEHYYEAKKLRDILADWEARYPKEKTNEPTRALTQKTVNQLKSLGYLK